MAEATDLPETLDPAAAGDADGGGGGFDSIVPDLSLSLRPPRLRELSDGASDSDSTSMLHVSRHHQSLVVANETDSDHLKLTLGLPNPTVFETHRVEGPEFFPGRPSPVIEFSGARHIGRDEAEYNVRMANFLFFEQRNEVNSGWITEVVEFDDDAEVDDGYLEIFPQGGIVDFGTMDMEMDDLLPSNNVQLNLELLEDEELSYYTYDDDNDMLVEVPEQDSPIRGAPPAARWVVDNLPSVVLTVEDVAKNNTICAVCKDEFGISEIAKKLPCSHYYHEECILPWLEVRNTCPLCRFELLTDDHEYEKQKEGLAGIGASSEET